MKSGSLEEIKTEAVRSVLDYLAKVCYENSRDHGFWDTGHDHPAILPSKIALCHSDLSEALECLRKPVPGFALNDIIWDMQDPKEKPSLQKPDGISAKPEGFAVKLADCVIRILDLCGRLRINLGQAILDKMEYNAKRPQMHDNKTC